MKSLLQEHGTINLFAYGTLMFPEIWRRVVGADYMSTAATARGFVVRRAVGRSFPVMLRGSEEAGAPGVVYLNVDEGALARIDDYESDIYVREEIAAVLEDGTTLRCQAYVLPVEQHGLASDEPWTAEWFRREAMTSYLKQMERWGL